MGTQVSGTVISGDRRQDAAGLLEDAGRLASRLAQAGVGADDTVALILRNDIAFITASVAANMLGATAVPVNWHFTAPEAAYVIADCDARAVIVHADLWRRIAPDLPADLLAGKLVIVVPTPPELAAAYRVSPEDGTAPQGAESLDAILQSCLPLSVEKPAPRTAMIYTSGTTGNPKGVRRLGTSVPSKYGYSAIFKPGVRTLLPTPLYHSAPNRFGVMTFACGGDLVVMPRFDPEELLRLVERHRITAMFIVPTMLVRLLKLPPEVRARYDVSSLSDVVCAGAPCPFEAKRGIIEWWGPCFHEFYGSTETGALTWCTSAEALDRPGTVGRAVPDATIKVYDEAGQECPPDTPGEVFGRLSGNADFTYHKRPEDRAAVEHEGLITSGDIGYLDADGYLFLSDRKRDMIIAGGVNIYPAHIEEAILTCPGVVDVAVFGIPDDEMGEAICAVVAPQPGGPAVDEATLRAHLSDRIARYMLPREIVIDPALPRDASGKVYKRKLRDRYWSDTGRAI